MIQFAKTSSKKITLLISNNKYYGLNKMNKLNYNILTLYSNVSRHLTLLTI